MKLHLNWRGLVVIFLEVFTETGNSYRKKEICKYIYYWYTFVQERKKKKPTKRPIKVGRALIALNILSWCSMGLTLVSLYRRRDGRAQERLSWCTATARRSSLHKSVNRLYVRKLHSKFSDSVANDFLFLLLDLLWIALGVYVGSCVKS